MILLKHAKTYLSLAICVFGLQAAGCGSGSSEAVARVSHPGYDKDAPTDVAVNSTNTLAVELYQRLSNEKGADANLFYSPLSISSDLMLTYEGASGETRAELERALSLTGVDSLEAHIAYAGVTGRLSGKKNTYELQTANALWAEQSKPLRKSYVDTIKKYYAVSIESVDFVNDHATQRDRINKWVALQTNDRIKNILGEDSLSEDTSVVLANAIYFNARWGQEFSERSTKPLPFFVQVDGGTDEKMVSMMHQSWVGFLFADMDGFKAVDLYYDRSPLSMLILLPDQRDGLPALEKSLSAELIQNTVESLKYEKLNLWLPKWKTTQKYELVPALESIGIHAAFDPDQSDFTLMRDSDTGLPLFISRVIHQSFISVDEEGTEAAAATVEEVADAAEDDIKEPIDFRCDHPFIYLIRDEQTGVILFMGRVTDPS